MRAAGGARMCASARRPGRRFDAAHAAPPSAA
ncbi:hypothetical protein M218_31270 [Burkholderia pseudomallei MSHR338]|nr:hypothetical protein M218_31270 [Burkholderia pseudomallei MSHR338]